MLTKRETVLDLDTKHRERAVFQNEYLWVEIPMEAFEEMGSPATITITVEPGDRLNVE